MRYGGHQTFFIREGWLFKGLKLVFEEPTRFHDPHIADVLGVGRNMAKSIEHWMLATGLTTKNPEGKKNKTKPKYLPTELAYLVTEHDQYFTRPETWWFLHLNLVNNPEDAATWEWFFNDYSSQRFDRAACLVSLTRAEEAARKRPSSGTTLERDLSCFLGSYAKDVPERRKDPEDEIDCPLQELELLTHYTNSNYFEISRRRKEVVPEVVHYSICAALGRQQEASGSQIDYSLHELARVRSGPLHAMALTTEALFETLLDMESAGYDLSIRGLAGDRQIRFQHTEPVSIARSFYERVSN